MFLALVMVAMLGPMVMNVTLDLGSLINTDSMFSYANILLVALGPVVLIGLGFALGKYIINFVQRIFSSI
jgi:hypothetical protein